MTSVQADTFAGPVVARLLAGLTPTARRPATAADAPFSVAVAVSEHVSGVLPLLSLLDADRHPAVAAARGGELPTALAVFTPNAELAGYVPPVRARWHGGRVLLSGRFRMGPSAAAALVTAATEAGDRVLCLVGQVNQEQGWVDLARTRRPDVVMSPPLSASDMAVVTSAVDDFAWIYAETVQRHTARLVADLRRSMVTTMAGDQPFSVSQFLAHELTRLDIELSLLGDAAQFGAGLRAEPGGGQAVSAVLAAGTELAHRVTVVCEEFVAQLGLPLPADVPGMREVLLSHFGGWRMVEAELARRMGLLTEAR